jgi:hypothetical protein
MPDYNVTLTEENFQSTVQYKTSVDYNKELNEPKKFLADFADVLLKRIGEFKQDQWLGVLQAVEDNLQQKQILVYSKDDQVEQKIQNQGFDGRILETDYDYLSVNNSNLAGTKTDLSVAQSIDLKSTILSDGSVINNLSISRDNQALEHNKDYLRVLVPQGSQLLSSTGFDDLDYHASTAQGFSTDPELNAWDTGEAHENVYARTESGKSEFAGWMDTAAGQSRTVTLTYILPFKVQSDQAYSILVQKQSGSKPIKFQGSLDLGKGKAKWIGQDVKPAANSVSFSSDTNTDDFWPLIITK